MIAGLDSSVPPTPAQARAAAAAGVGLWSGYLSTAPYDGNSHFGLWHPWPQAGFEAARLCGATPIAFCSGWDSPGALKALAASWNLRLCLDVENGIRADGPWVQPWLAASGAGLYGNYGCHTGRLAPFHVLSAYPGSSDVRATWWSATPRPASPCAWQWAGTHPEFGVSVDRGDYDDFFAGLHGGGGGTLGGFLMALSDAEQLQLKQRVDALWTFLENGPPASGAWHDAFAKLATKADLTAPTSPDLTQLQADIATIKDILTNRGLKAA